MSAEVIPYFCADCDSELQPGQSVRQPDGRTICSECKRKLERIQSDRAQADLFVEQGSLFNPGQRRANVEGYTDPGGTFHPIRASEDYNEFLAGDYEPRQRPTAKQQEQLRADREAEQREVERVERESTGLTKSLAGFVRAFGGMTPGGMFAGEVERLSPKETGTTGLINRKARQGSQKQTPEYVMDGANARGYRDPRTGRPFEHVADFIDAVEMAARKDSEKSESRHRRRGPSQKERDARTRAKAERDYMAAENPHKSYSRLSARRVKAERPLRVRAQKLYDEAARLEAKGKPVQARATATKARTLLRRAMHAGQYSEGPIGELPNPEPVKLVYGWVETPTGRFGVRLWLPLDLSDADIEKRVRAILKRNYPGWKYGGWRVEEIKSNPADEIPNPLDKPFIVPGKHVQAVLTQRPGEKIVGQLVTRSKSGLGVYPVGPQGKRAKTFKTMEGAKKWARSIVAKFDAAAEGRGPGWNLTRNPEMFGAEAVASARQVTRVRTVVEKATGATGEIISVAPGGFLKVKWHNRAVPTLIRRDMVKRAKANPQSMSDAALASRLWRKYVRQSTAELDENYLLEVIKREAGLAEKGVIKVSPGLLTELRRDRALAGGLAKRAKANPHKSYSRLSAKRARAEGPVRAKADRLYREAAALEAKGKPLQARITATKARGLTKRAMRAGQYSEGPVGELPNPRGKPRRCDCENIACRVAHELGGCPNRGKVSDTWGGRLCEKCAKYMPKEYLEKFGKQNPNPVTAALRFRDLNIGDEFDFISGSFDSFFDRVVKTGSRTYRRADQAAEIEQAKEFARIYKYKYKPPKDMRVGSVDAKVYHVVRANPKTGSRDPFGVWHPNPAGGVSALSGWNQYAGGTGAAPGKYSYDYRISVADSASGRDLSLQYMIDPYASQYGRHLGYRLKVFGAPPHYGYSDIGGTFRTAAGAAAVARSHYKALAAKTNPSVSDISRDFQGKTSGVVNEYRAASNAPSDLARIGKLVFLKVESLRRAVRVPGAMVAADTKGKLWLVGKSAPMFNRKAKQGERLDYGPVTSICYETAKQHIGNGKRYEYVHQFGEDGGKRPRLLIDYEGMPILSGGDYQIKAEGIVN